MLLFCLLKPILSIGAPQLVKGEPEQVEDFVERFSKLRQIKTDTSIILLDSYVSGHFNALPSVCGHFCTSLLVILN